MKIHYFSGEPWEEGYVSAKLSGHAIVFHASPLGAGDADPDAEALSVFIDSNVGAGEMARFPKLKLIATRSTGFDHIDIKAAAARGIALANVPYYGENTVAEFAFALLLALSRAIVEADTRVKASGIFSQTGLRGFDLAGKTMGLIGCGHIGRHMVQLSRGFGMKVLAYDLRQNAELLKSPDFAYAPLNELLARSDIVSIHAPYNKHTHHLLNRDNIGLLKKGAILINTARGAIVETEALVSALKDGSLAGAGLDVLEEEGEFADEEMLLSAPHPNEAKLRTALANHYLIKHPRVLVTPHIAFNTEEAVRRIVDTTIENIENFAEGKPVNTISISA